MKTTLILLPALLSASVAFAQTQKGADIDGEAVNDQSGFSISMPDAVTVAIGAHLNDGGGSDAGHARVWSWNGTAWTQKGADLDGAAGDEAGYSVNMPDANTVAVGAALNDAAASNAGHVRVYAWSGTAWTQKGAAINGVSSNDFAGRGISMPTANMIAVGAQNAEPTGFSNVGHVRIFAWNGSAWVQRGATIFGEDNSDESGLSASMPDTATVAIGAHLNDGTGTDAGHVRVYSWSGTAWVQKGGDINGEAAGDQSGRSVSMPDANTVAIGAPFNDGAASDAGHVRVYGWNGTAWVQKGADINGESFDNYAGFSTSMADANTLAVGSYRYGGGAQPGRVRLFKWSGSAWTQMGTNINGESSGDNLGVCVSMPDSNTVGIGAYLNDGGGSDAGHVRVYTVGMPAGVQLLPSVPVAGIHPNPASSAASVTGLTRDHRLSVFSADGRALPAPARYDEGVGIWEIDLSRMAAGIYTLRVEAPDGECSAVRLVRR